MAKTELAVAGIPAKDIQVMESICNQFSLDKISNDMTINSVLSAFTIAEGIKQLTHAITPEMMKPIMFLQGNQLGFLTDKDVTQGYDVPTVKLCCVQALMMGAKLAGNEFNIISSKTYLTLNHFVRKVRETPGLTDFDPRIYLKSADVKQGTTIDVSYKVTWKLDGKGMAIEGSIPVRINKNMGADAALGKARRKILARVDQYIHGSEHTMPEGDINDCDVRPGGPQAFTREEGVIDVEATLGSATEATTAPGGTSESSLKPDANRDDYLEGATNANSAVEVRSEPEDADHEPITPQDEPETEPPGIDTSNDAPDLTSEPETEDEGGAMQSPVQQAKADWKAKLLEIKGVDASDEFVERQLGEFCMKYWSKMSLEETAEKKPDWMPKLLGFIENSGKADIGIPIARYAFELQLEKKRIAEWEADAKPNRPGKRRRSSK
ncbi:MAG: hypothetical protein KAS32_26450 [Candidatus Peribacteraceae bacterium]|nr:hypothetical protein [Candidatus Peribacteraceae bacterium]